MDNMFIFVTGDMEFIGFEETKEEKGALIEITAVELNKLSQQTPPTMYRLEEKETIAASLIGCPVRFGSNFFGKHNKNTSKIGIVKKTRILGNKIKATVLITAKRFVKLIKKGQKFLFSVGGEALTVVEETVKKTGQIIRKMIGAVCNHLQMVPLGTVVGFPNAKIEKVIEINETVMYVFNDPVDIMIEDAIETGIISRYIRRFM